MRIWWHLLQLSEIMTNIFHIFFFFFIWPFLDKNYWQSPWMKNENNPCCSDIQCGSWYSAIFSLTITLAVITTACPLLLLLWLSCGGWPQPSFTAGCENGKNPRKEKKHKKQKHSLSIAEKPISGKMGDWGIMGSHAEPGWRTVYPTYLNFML